MVSNTILPPAPGAVPANCACLAAADMVPLQVPALSALRGFVVDSWSSDRLIGVQHFDILVVALSVTPTLHPPAGDLKLPILFVSGLKDTVVPKAMMARLHSLASSSIDKQLLKISTGNHDLTWKYGGKLFRDQIAQFVNRCVDGNVC